MKTILTIVILQVLFGVDSLIKEFNRWEIKEYPYAAWDRKTEMVFIHKPIMPNFIFKAEKALPRIEQN